MKRFPMAFWVFLVGVAVNAGQILLLSPLLPARVASHFGVDGRADGFMPRETFVGSQWILIAFVSAIFLALPALIRTVPDDAINLPNKEHWLALERREATIAYIGDRMFAFAAATLALLSGVMSSVFKANVDATQTMGNMVWLYLVFYLLYTSVWVYGLLRGFSRATLPIV